MAEKLLFKVRVERTRGGDETGTFYLLADTIELAQDKALSAAEDKWDVQPEMALAPSATVFEPALKATAVSEVNGTWVP